VNSRTLLILIAADCVLIPAVMFCIVFVTAADQPTRTQKIVALFLVAVLLTLILALIAMIVLILRRRTRAA
jgi:hypothetical protein